MSKRGKPRPQFGAIGTTPIDYTERPFEHRGAVSGALYVWSLSKPWPRDIDCRDVPKLIKDLGTDNLSGPAVDEYLDAMTTKATKRSAKKKEKEGNVSVNSNQDDAGA